ncbi:hypothetical protein CK217_31780 [Mesorhizobium loti]|nr:hypothetical protein CK217_31780 [Mesorhizobium loti]
MHGEVGTNGWQASLKSYVYDLVGVQPRKSTDAFFDIEETHNEPRSKPRHVAKLVHRERRSVLDLDEVRKRGPLVWETRMNCWLAISYDASKIIESDEDISRIIYVDASAKTLDINGDATGVSVMLARNTRSCAGFISISLAAVPCFG